MMLKNRSVSRTMWRCLLLFCLLLSSTTLAQTVQNCPSVVAIAPCTCAVKTVGLDIICEFTDHIQISKAMNVLRGQPNTVISYLKLRHNNLPKLQSFVFLGLTVKHLTIHNSSLAAVEDNTFSSSGTLLTVLDLSQNSLVSVPSASLTKLHKLLNLNLNQNRITNLPARSFADLGSLVILNLYGNNISNIDREAFIGSDNRKLKRLNLSGNQLTSVPTSALSSMYILRKLAMDYNNIVSINEGDFEGLISLDSLGLAHNQLRKVPARVFSQLSQLFSLDLDGNQITSVDPDAFIGLEDNLQYLGLGNNNLHIVPSEALRRLNRLRHLDLRSNNITFLSEDAFTDFGDSMTYLNLQKNLIKALPPMIFEKLNSLETLDLQNNKIVYIPEDITDTVLDTLRMIDITDNPLICVCELRWFSTWLKNLRDKDDQMMSKKRTVCMMIAENREYPVQHIPLERMGCEGINAVATGESAHISIYLLSITHITLLAGTVVLL